MFLDDAMLTAYRSWAEGLCAPVFWRRPDGRMNNGTITFLRTSLMVLGLTNAHVADGLANSNDRGWQLGNAQFDPNRIIARHPTIDLATYQLSDVFLAAAGKDAATVPAWPPRPPAIDEPIVLGGYPAIYREITPGSVEFGFAWFAGQASVEGETTIGIVLDLAQSIATTSRRIPTNPSLGGCSGGPVFRVVDCNGIERLELGAIIYQYSQSSETMLAHPLTTLAEDGSFV